MQLCLNPHWLEQITLYVILAFTIAVVVVAFDDVGKK